MKKAANSITILFLFLLCLLPAPNARAKGPEIVHPITILLLSKASTIHQVRIPDSFSWQTSKTLKLEIQILASDEFGNERPINNKKLLTIYAASAGDSVFSEVLLKRLTDENGRLEVVLTLPASSSKVKVAALTNSRNNPSKILHITNQGSVKISLKMSDVTGGEGRKANDTADW